MPAEISEKPGHRLAQKLAGPIERLRTPARLMGRHGSILLSILIAIAILWAVRDWDWQALSIPRSPLFWAAFALYFAGAPFIEWVIMRRLWGVPWSGMLAVVRKMVCNEMLLSYSGDAYFYAWLRSAVPRVASPFAVVKDLALLSALMGSVATIVSLLIMLPLVPASELRLLQSPILIGLGLALASGGVITFFSRRLLSLPREQVRFIAGAHGLRIVGQAVCAIVMWHALMPQVPLSGWIFLTAVRMLATRLPLFASKELAFAAAAVTLLGRFDGITPMIMLITALIMGANLLVAAGLMIQPWILPLRRPATA